MTPQARQDGLLIEKIEDELVVYDQQRNRAHRLNGTAALVWQNCDGEKTVADIAALLQRQLNQVADEDLVWVTLDRLEAAHLLQRPIERSPDQRRASRRQFVRKIGTVGVLSLLLPAVLSILAPTPAKAGSCFTTCNRCSG